MNATGRISRASLAPALAAVVLAGGCRTAGVDYSRPAFDVPADFRHAAAPAAPAAAPANIEAWWTIFADPALDELEAAALAQSPQLAAAVARVDEARARFGFARAETRVAVTGSGTSRVVGETAEREIPVPGRPLTFRERGDWYRAGVDGSYELDLWGRVKRSLESAQAQVAASEADQRAVRLVLTTDVATAYFAGRTLESVTEILKRTATMRRDAVDVLQARFDAGLSPELDVNRARVELATVEAELADAQRRRDQAVNALAVLTGRTPAAFAENSAGRGLASVAVPPAIPAGLPSSLLRRRPDLAASEALLQARTAEIGVAEAARFPSIRLTGSAGFESLELGSLLGRPSQYWQFGPAFTMPLLDGGRTRSNLAVAHARTAAAAAEYRQRGLTAFRDVEDALVELRRQAEQAEAQRRAEVSAAELVRLASVRYERGFASYLEVVDAQRTALQIERARAELAGARHAATVRLIRALGGGWE